MCFQILSWIRIMIHDTAVSHVTDVVCLPNPTAVHETDRFTFSTCNGFPKYNLSIEESFYSLFLADKWKDLKFHIRLDKSLSYVRDLF